VTVSSVTPSLPPAVERGIVESTWAEYLMTGFHFIDHEGTDWMILAGLPTDFPDGGEGHGPVAGLTFPSGGGEGRVLPRAAFPRRASADPPVAPLGTRSRVFGLESAHWEDLLRQAVVWPPP